MSDAVIVSLIGAGASIIAAVASAVAVVYSSGTRREMTVVKTQTNHLTELAVIEAGRSGRAEGKLEERQIGADRAVEVADARHETELAAAEKRTPGESSA